MLWKNRKRIVSIYGYTDQVHIGMHKNKDGFWETIFGKKLSDGAYVHWAKNEPNNGGAPNVGTEDCASLYNIDGMNDVFCHRELAYICERPLHFQGRPFRKV